MASTNQRLMKSAVSFVRNALSAARTSSYASSARVNPKPMGNILYSAVCVERLPVITTPKTKIEQKFTDMMSQLELENSYFSDHEIRIQREEQAARKKQEAEDDEGGASVAEGETERALDLEDKWEAELKAFTPAPRTTEADEKDDRRSVQRRLDSSLFLLVKQNIEGRDHWVLPQATWQDGETMRQTAEKALKSVCGDVSATFIGNAPCSVAQYDPPNKEEEKGIKLFFFKAWYRGGDVKPNKHLASDFLWVTKDELPQYCHNSYNKHLKKFIFDL